MTFILTFLGKGGVGCTTLATAAARKYASAGKKVLLVTRDSVGVDAWGNITPLGNNLDAIQLQTSQLLETIWEKLKQLEAQYLRSPLLKHIYGQELSIIPGMDDALALYFLREQYQSGNYDIIIYDGHSSLNTLRMFGLPDTLSWYLRRFQNLLENSDIVKALSPFVQPVSSAILNVTLTPENITPQPVQDFSHILEEGKQAIADSTRVCAFLVTDASVNAIAAAKYCWGGAQQVNLSVGGVLLNEGEKESSSLVAKIAGFVAGNYDRDNTLEQLRNEFKPLPVCLIRRNRETIIEDLPDFQILAADAPKPLTINPVQREIRVFLPGFSKKEVKLSQSGPEITISAGDQRRNIFLPPPLKGQPVKSAKFQDNYLIITL
ncbi:MAG: ArsA family ATPase [Geminocystis sp.]|nr:ArsA family ATPase [Geminocystis sp.]HIK36384.1 ArsA family ATPase [Geminocystis sp. M7585_C2015_104]MCS7147979.1 ArsA family ATPase [Geminocystis sp.]MCX8078953.1 ArsA family ATPase [Geminocystis sp.]MDW8116941.1 ArsA family ATPase [Geminocystis sp.]